MSGNEHSLAVINVSFLSNGFFEFCYEKFYNRHWNETDSGIGKKYIVRSFLIHSSAIFIRERTEKIYNNTKRKKELFGP